MRIIIKADYGSASSEAARIIAESVQANPRIVLALPTGNTPKQMYADLARMFATGRLDFRRTVTFNLDELAGLEPGNPLTFRAYMHHEFFDHINIAQENIHIPEDAAYEAEIRNAGGIDLLVCGIGTNGHIAFNEPASDFQSRTRIVTLASETVEGLRNQYPTGSAIPERAVTMGIATILDARRILLLASGQRKADILRRAIEEPPTLSVPASALQSHPEVTIVVDRGAAADLERFT